jgi:hypothetical protein
LKNNELEGEDVFIFMYEVDSRDLALNNVPAEYRIIDPNALQI